LVPDTGRMAQELGFKVTVSLDDALQKTIAWHRSLKG
jgi:nucleoside-diphosphate-sugar epimerase